MLRLIAQHEEHATIASNYCYRYICASSLWKQSLTAVSDNKSQGSTLQLLLPGVGVLQSRQAAEADAATQGCFCHGQQ